MNSKEPDARIRIDKMLIESGWKLPGWSKDEEINVKTEIKNDFGPGDNGLNLLLSEILCIKERFFEKDSDQSQTQPNGDSGSELEAQHDYLSQSYPEEGPGSNCNRFQWRGIPCHWPTSPD